MNQYIDSNPQSQQPFVRKITDWRSVNVDNREKCRELDEYIARRTGFPLEFMYAPNFCINVKDAMDLIVDLPCIFTLQSTENGWRAWFDFEFNRRYTAEANTPALAICLTWIEYDNDVLSRAGVK